MDKICRGSSVGRLHLESPRRGPNETPPKVLTRMESSPASSLSGPRLRHSLSDFRMQASAHEMSPAGVRSPGRPTRSLSSYTRPESGKSLWGANRDTWGEEMRTPRSTAWSIGKGAADAMEDPAQSPRSPGRLRLAAGMPPPAAGLKQVASACASPRSPPRDGTPVRLGAGPGSPDERLESWLASPRNRAALAGCGFRPSGFSPRKRPEFFTDLMATPEHSMRSTRSGEGPYMSPTASVSPSVSGRRGASPTFRTSPDFTLFGAGGGDGDGGSAVFFSELGGDGSVYPMKPDRQADNPFSARRMRQQCGRITETSTNVIAHAEPTGEQAPTFITNSENYAISRGKRVGLVKEATEVKARMAMDLEQPLPTRSQKRHECGVVEHTPNTAVGSPQLLCRQSVVPSWSPARASCPALRMVVPQSVTSTGMSASLRPEAAEPAPRGRQSLEGGRRQFVDSSRREALQMSPRSPAVPTLAFTPRHAASSDGVREQFTPLAQPVVLRAPVPVVYASSPVASRGLATMSVGSMGGSAMPSTMSKEAAYLQSGISVVRHIPRSAGQFSPHAARVPVREVVHL